MWQATDVVLASTTEGQLQRSEDGGRSFFPVPRAPRLTALAWSPSALLYGTSRDGTWSPAVTVVSAGRQPETGRTGRRSDLGQGQHRLRRHRHRHLQLHRRRRHLRYGFSRTRALDEGHEQEAVTACHLRKQRWKARADTSV